MNKLSIDNSCIEENGAFMPNIKRGENNVTQTLHNICNI